MAKIKKQPVFMLRVDDLIPEFIVNLLKLLIFATAYTRGEFTALFGGMNREAKSKVVEVTFTQGGTRVLVMLATPEGTCTLEMAPPVHQGVLDLIIDFRRTVENRGWQELGAKLALKAEAGKANPLVVMPFTRGTDEGVKTDPDAQPLGEGVFRSRVIAQNTWDLITRISYATDSFTLDEFYEEQARLPKSLRSCSKSELARYLQQKYIDDNEYGELKLIDGVYHLVKDMGSFDDLEEPIPQIVINATAHLHPPTPSTAREEIEALTATQSEAATEETQNPPEPDEDSSFLEELIRDGLVEPVRRAAEPTGPDIIDTGILIDEILENSSELSPVIEEPQSVVPPLAVPVKPQITVADLEMAAKYDQILKSLHPDVRLKMWFGATDAIAIVSPLSRALLNEASFVQGRMSIGVEDDYLFATGYFDTVVCTGIDQRSVGVTFGAQLAAGWVLFRVKFCPDKKSSLGRLFDALEGAAQRTTRRIKV